MFENMGENGGSGDGEDAGIHVVKLRGLPFSTTPKEVLDFLDGVEVVGGVNGVTLIETRPGRPSGECFVEVASEHDLQQALAKDKQHMGKRYIEGVEVCTDGVDILYDRTGRSTGEAFVYLEDEDSATRALHKDREKIGHRYIEVFSSSAEEAQAWHARDAPWGGGGGGGRVLNARAFPRHAPYDRPQRFQRPAQQFRNHDILQAAAAR